MFTFGTIFGGTNAFVYCLKFLDDIKCFFFFNLQRYVFASFWFLMFISKNIYRSTLNLVL